MSDDPNKVRSLPEILREAADDLEKHNNNIKVARMAGSALAVISSLGAVASAIAIPFTLGASVAPAIACLSFSGVASAGSLTSNGAVLTGFIIDTRKKKEMKQKWQEFMKEFGPKEDQPAFPGSCWNFGEIAKEIRSQGLSLKGQAGKVVENLDQSAALAEGTAESIVLTVATDANDSASVASATRTMNTGTTKQTAEVNGRSKVNGALQSSIVARIVAPLIAINALLFLENLSVLIEASIALSRKTKSAAGDLLRLAARGLDVIVEKEAGRAKENGQSMASEVTEKVRSMQSLLQEAADKLDAHDKHVKKARWAISAVGVISTVGAVACAIAIPFTFGISIAPLITCASFSGTAALGSISSVGVSQWFAFNEKKKKDKLEEKWKDLKETFQECEELHNVSSALKSTWSWGQVASEVANNIGTCYTLADAVLLGFTSHAVAAEVAIQSVAQEAAASASAVVSVTDTGITTAARAVPKTGTTTAVSAVPKTGTTTAASSAIKTGTSTAASAVPKTGTTTAASAAIKTGTSTAASAVPKTGTTTAASAAIKTGTSTAASAVPKTGTTTAASAATKTGTTTGVATSPTAAATTAETGTTAANQIFLQVAGPLIAVNAISVVVNAIELVQATNAFRKKTKSDVAELLRLAACGLESFIPESKTEQGKVEDCRIEQDEMNDGGMEQAANDEGEIKFEQGDMEEDQSMEEETEDERAPLLNSDS